VMARPERSHWDPLPAVAQAMADGEPWLLAWSLQSITSYRSLSRASGLSNHRLEEIYCGAPVTREELSALAKAWRAEPRDLVLTLPASMQA
jgi:hypothetical protein